jgi:hypothetical protein
MAYSFNDWKDKMGVKLFGRQIGLDRNEYVVGPKGVRSVVEVSTETNGTVNKHGMSVITSTAGVWLLEAPQFVGHEKTIVNGSAATTATLQVVRTSSGSGVTILGSTGAGGVKINLINAGASVRLVGISTSVWAPVANTVLGSTPYMTVSTSS